MSEISPRAPELYAGTRIYFKDHEGTEFGNVSFGVPAGSFDKTGFEGTINSNFITFEYYGADYEVILYIKGVSNTTETELITFRLSSVLPGEDTIEIPDEYLDESTLQFRIVCEGVSVDETWSVAYSKTSDRVMRTGSASFEITSTTENATIYYTIDGTEPTTESSVYSDSISTTENITVKALATREGLLNSNITSTDIKVKLPDPELSQVVNGDKGTLSITNSYDSYEGVTFKISKDYGDYSEESFPYEVTSNGTYITQAISAGKNVNSNKVPVKVTELKASDPSIDVDDPELNNSFDITFTEKQNVEGLGEYPATTASGIVDFVEANANWISIGDSMYYCNNILPTLKVNNTEYIAQIFYKVSNEQSTSYQIGLYNLLAENPNSTEIVLIIGVKANNGVFQKDLCILNDSRNPVELPATATLKKIEDTFSFKMFKNPSLVDAEMEGFDMIPTAQADGLTDWVLFKSANSIEEAEGGSLAANIEATIYFEEIDKTVILTADKESTNGGISVAVDSNSTSAVNLLDAFPGTSATFAIYCLIALNPSSGSIPSFMKKDFCYFAASDEQFIPVENISVTLKAINATIV